MTTYTPAQARDVAIMLDRLKPRCSLDIEAHTVIRSLATLVEAEALKSQQQAINAAVMAERYACVDIANEWAVKYSQTGIASCTAGAAILRARTQPAPTSAQMEE